MTIQDYSSTPRLVEIAERLDAIKDSREPESFRELIRLFDEAEAIRRAGT